MQETIPLQSAQLNSIQEFDTDTHLERPYLSKDFPTRQDDAPPMAMPNEPHPRNDGKVSKVSLPMDLTLSLNTQKKIDYSTNEIAADKEQKSAKLKNSVTSREEKEVLVGTPVKKGHQNYLLMFDMLTGIRISGKRFVNCEVKEPTLNDFKVATKLAFDEEGNELTPKSEYDFKFKDYAPGVFFPIRKIFKVDSEDYINSLTSKLVLSELGSPGKSGSFFYFSLDYRFIIKTIHHNEHSFLRKILMGYYEHVKSNPNTLLSRILGLHRVKLPGNKKIHFVVMGNVFPPHKDIHEIYDLKGSTAGRSCDAPDLDKPGVVMKDLDWLSRNKSISLGPTKSKILAEQMALDVQFLTKNNIMDYSLLIGYHNTIKGNNFSVKERSLVLMETMQSIVKDDESPTSFSPVSSYTPGSFNGNKTGKPVKKKRSRTVSESISLSPTNNRMTSPPERRDFIFYKDFGGFQSTDDEDGVTSVVYYIGIIDIFTEYTIKKKVETVFKSLTEKMRNISSVNPKRYGARFLEFFKKAIVPISSSERKPPLRSTSEAFSDILPLDNASTVEANEAFKLLTNTVVILGRLSNRPSVTAQRDSVDKSEKERQDSPLEKMASISKIGRNTISRVPSSEQTPD